MNSRSIAVFNRRIEALYRAVYLHEPLYVIAAAIGVKSHQVVRQILTAGEKDDRVLRAVAMRASAEERKLNALFEEGYRAQS